MRARAFLPHLARNHPVEHPTSATPPPPAIVAAMTHSLHPAATPHLVASQVPGCLEVETSSRLGPGPGGGFVVDLPPGPGPS